MRAAFLLQRAPSSGVHSRGLSAGARRRDRKSTRLNSSHQIISYAVFCLKKNKYITAYLLETPAAYPRFPDEGIAGDPPLFTVADEVGAVRRLIVPAERWQRAPPALLGTF